MDTADNLLLRQLLAEWFRAFAKTNSFYLLKNTLRQREREICTEAYRFLWSACAWPMYRKRGGFAVVSTPYPGQPRPPFFEWGENWINNCFILLATVIARICFKVMRARRCLCSCSRWICALWWSAPNTLFCLCSQFGAASLSIVGTLT